MRHPIDPKIDCVFKALLGAEANERLLRHFLNAMLGTELPEPVVEVAILNPHNEREFLDDKLSVVDVKASDQRGRLYQIEIQLLVLPELPARILYGWADLYSAQLRSGEDYSELRPSYAIWLLGETLLPHVPDYAHRYRLRDEHGRGLIEHGGIWLFELTKFAVERVQTEEERWLKFFNEGEHLEEGQLPDWMQTNEMRQAMGTLREFSEKERAYHAYQSRQNYLRQQRSIEKHMEALMAEAEQAREEREQAQRDAEQAQRDAEQAQRDAKQAQMEAIQAQMEAEQQRAEKEQVKAVEERERAEKEAALAEIERLKQLLEGDPTV